MPAAYLLATAAACFLAAGIVPMAVILAGLWHGIRRSDLRALLNGFRFITWFYGTVAVICLLVAASHWLALSRPGWQALSAVEHRGFLWFFGAAAVVSGAGWALTKYALLPAFLPWRARVAANGFWGGSAGEVRAAAPNRLAQALASSDHMRPDAGGADIGRNDLPEPVARVAA